MEDKPNEYRVGRKHQKKKNMIAILILALSCLCVFHRRIAPHSETLPKEKTETSWNIAQQKDRFGKKNLEKIRISKRHATPQNCG